MGLHAEIPLIAAECILGSRALSFVLERTVVRAINVASTTVPTLGNRVQSGGRAVAEFVRPACVSGGDGIAGV
jgi:hypothetical protein